MERATFEKPELRVQAGSSHRSGVKPYYDRIFITWLPYSRRSQTLAESFDAEPVYFKYLAGKNNVPKAILRYIIMTFHTVLHVLMKRPRIVFVMNQPIFLPLTLLFLHYLTGVQYVIDSHSGLFNKAQWKWSLPVMRFAYRNSLFSIVTNQKHKQLTESWGAKIEVLGALSVSEEPVVQSDRSDALSIVVIGTFATDEPTEEVIEACGQLPEVRFYITGALKNAPAGLIKNAPENVTFTDFQPRPNYVGLVQAMDGAIILVTNDDVMQMGAYEAMSWAVPIITSDWQVLRENFYRGALFVDNTSSDIVRAVKELQDNLDFYKSEVTELRRERKETWENTISRIDQYILDNT